ncbi:MAG: F0F1 ATP synthase subunit alpha, partial [Actinobacteria bacterium]|nr:F0F1 ATP synthase subunit alpha [Actinomycetota bacterium]
FIARERKEINAVISETKQLDDDTIAKMEEAVASFKKQFKSSASHALNEAPAEALDGEEAEQITKFVPPAEERF